MVPPKPILNCALSHLASGIVTNSIPGPPKLILNLTSNLTRQITLNGQLPSISFFFLDLHDHINGTQLPIATSGDKRLVDWDATDHHARGVISQSVAIDIHMELRNLTTV